MKRITFIEQVRRQIYGGQPSADAEITVGLVNAWLSSAIANAAKQNYIDIAKLDGIACVNNSFYISFKGLSVTSDEQFVWKIQLPEIPVGIGSDEGVSTLQFKDAQSKQISQTVVWLTQNQKTYFSGMRPIPNKILAYSEGQFVYVLTPLLLNTYTANVTMVSGGDSTDLDSTLNVPFDYHQPMIEYLKAQLMFERGVPVDNVEDGVDGPIKTT